jgi:hypothetical protein
VEVFAQGTLTTHESSLVEAVISGAHAALP